MGGLVDISLDRLTVARSGTATRVNSAGLIETVAANAPRLDYDPVTLACRGVLVEESRTNYFPASGAIYAAPWGASAALGHAASAIGSAPDGAGQWAEITAGTGGGDWRLSTGSLSGGGGNVYAASVYAKRGNQPLARFQVHMVGGATAFAAVEYNFDTGVFSTTGGDGGAVDGGDGAVRLWTKITDDSDSVDIEPNILLHTGFSSGETTLYWGAQIEQGAMPTSYIPTTTAAATRNVDVVTTALSNDAALSTAQGTVFVEVMPQADASLPQIAMQIDGGPSSVRMFRAGGSLVAEVEAWDEIAVTLISGSLPIKGIGRAALAWAANDFALSVNGGAVMTDASGAAPSGMGTLRIGSWGGSLPFTGHIRRLQYFPRRLSNTELQSLTA